MSIYRYIDTHQLYRYMHRPEPKKYSKQWPSDLVFSDKGHELGTLEVQVRTFRILAGLYVC